MNRDRTNSLRLFHQLAAAWLIGVLAPQFVQGAAAGDLRGALDVFTGEWDGEMKIHALDGFLLKTVSVERRYSWKGEEQVVETRFSDDGVDYTSEARQFIQLGRLQSTVTRTGMPPEQFAGTLAEGGISWTNAERNSRDYKERITARGEARTIEATSFEILRMKGISGLCRVALTLKARAPLVAVAASSSRESAESAARIAALEAELAAVRATIGTASARAAAVTDERDALRSRVDSLESDARRLVETVRGLETERDQLNTSVSELRRASASAAAPDPGPLLQARSEAASAAERIKTLEAAQSSLEARADEAGRRATDLQAQLATASSTRERAESSAAGLRTDNESLHRRITAMEAEKAQLEGRVATAEKAAGTSAAEKTRVAEATASLEKQLAEVRTQLAEERGGTTAAAQRATAAEAERDRLATRLADAPNPDALRGELTAAGTKLERAESIAAGLRSDNESLHRRITSMEAEQARLEARASAAETAAGTSAAEKTRIAEATASLEKQLSETREQLSAARTGAADAVRRATAVEAERDRLADRLAEAAKSLAARNDEAGNAAELARTLAGREQELAALQQRFDRSTQDMEALTREAEKLRKDRDASLQQIARLERREQSSSARASETVEISRQLVEVQAARERIATENRELAQRLEATRADLEAARAGASADSARVEKLERDLAAAVAAGETGRNELAGLKSSLTSANNRANDLIDLLAQAETASKQAVADLEKARRDNEALSRRAGSGGAELARLQSRVTELETAVAAAEQAKREALASVGDEARNRETLNARVAALEADLASAATAGDALRKERDATALRVSELERRPMPDTAAIEAERRELRERIDRLTGERLEALGRATELERELASVRQSAPSADELKKLESERDVARRAAAASEEQIRQARAGQEALALRVAALEREQSGFQSEIERARSVAAAAQHRATTAEGRVTDLEASAAALAGLRAELDRERTLAAQRQRDGEELSARVRELQEELANAPRAAVVAPASPIEGVGTPEQLHARIDRLDRRVIEIESERNAARERTAVLESQLSEAQRLRDSTLARFQDVVSQLNAVREERDRLSRANVSLEADARAARTAAGRAASAETTEGSPGMLSRFLSSIGGDGAPTAGGAGGSRSIEAAITGYDVVGVTKTEAEEKMILNGRVVRAGEVVDEALGLTFMRIENDSLVFRDASGREYRRRF